VRVEYKTCIFSLSQDVFIEPPQAYPWKKEIHVPANDTDAGGGGMGLGWTGTPRT
jgi:hypothetical protein